MPVLRQAAVYGRLLLGFGLICGFVLPGVAAAMKPMLPAMVAFLVFVSALRIGAKAALGSLAEARGTGAWVIVFQVAVPLAGLAVLSLAGIAGTPAGLAILLALCGSSISGGPTFTALLGHDPAPALRILILGTLLLPVTILPVLWFSPALGGLWEVALTALRLTVVIAAAVACAFTVRRVFFPDPGPEGVQALDGLAAITLAVIVVGLMSAVGPALAEDPGGLALWMLLAFAVNFGQQVGTRLAGGSVAASVAGGNRNIALFLVALPVAVTDPILIFIGCYQVPMYLTPLVMERFYGKA